MKKIYEFVMKKEEGLVYLAGVPEIGRAHV